MPKNLNNYSFNKFNIDDLSNGLSIYDANDVFKSSNDDYYNEFEKKDNFIIDESDDILNTYIDFSKNITYDDCVEDCSTCIYRHNGVCLLKDIDISISDYYPTDCWQYKNSITMRTSSDFQDDYDERYDNFD